MYDGKHVVQTQSYGAEARGSAAQSEVIISDHVIKYPKVRQCDILIAMSQPALNKYVKNLKEGGFLFLDRDMIKTVPKLEARIFQVPATSTAEAKLKRKIYANTVMLGALTKATTIISQEAMKSTIKDSVPKEMLRNNLRGFQLGLQLVEAHRAAT